MRSKKKNLFEFFFITVFLFLVPLPCFLGKGVVLCGGNELTTGGVWDGKQGRHHRVSDHRVSLGGRVEE